MTALRRLVVAFWFGAGTAILAIAAPAAFRHGGSAAADVVGAMLAPWHWIALVAPVLALLLRARRRPVLALLALGLLLAAGQLLLDLRIHAIRAASPVPISSLSKEDPVRKHFGALHGISSGLMLLEVIATAAVVALDRD